MFIKIYKILLSFFLLGIIWSCEEIPNGNIEPTTLDYTVESISAPSKFVYSETNKSISPSIVVKNTSTINRVWFNIISENGFEDISMINQMSTTQNVNTKTYIGQVNLDENLLSGNYVIEFFIEDNVRSSGENVAKVGAKKFEYFSDAQNLPPILSNLSIPSEVSRNTEFVFSVAVNDPNGQADIQIVYFKLKRPDGSIVYSNPDTNLEEFPMFDDAKLGDRVAGDGVYSLKNSFGTSSQRGEWTFTFAAIDYSDSMSNVLTHKLKVN